MKRFSFSVLLLLGSLATASTTFGQHPVLFETFTNVCKVCPDPRRVTFYNDVESVLAARGTQIIHLDYHIGDICDPWMVVNPHGTAMAKKLSGLPQNQDNYQPYFGAVDRTVFSSTGLRGSPLNSSGSDADWNTAITAVINNPATASVTLKNATLDKKVGRQWTLQADVTVTALRNITGLLKVYFVVAQDNMDNPHSCGSEASHYDDVVRWSDTVGVVVFTNGATTGATKQISWAKNISSPTEDASFNYADMKLIAILEQTVGTDYHVVNTAVLRKDFDTLQSPPPSLGFYPNTVDGATYVVGGTQFIGFQMSHVDSAAIYYSVDNGVNWHLIVTAMPGAFPQFTWTVPDSVTTQGKFKLVGLPDGTPLAIQEGNFSIKRGAYISLLHPNNERAKGGTNFVIEWKPSGVDTVNLRYSLNNDGIWKTIGYRLFNKTTYTWKVPDTTAFATVEITPFTPGEAPAQQGTLEIYQLVPNEGVDPNSATSQLSIESIYPNPARNSQPIMRYRAPEAAHLLLQVYDVVGRERYRENLVGQSDGAMQLPTNELPPGNYIVRLSSERFVNSKQITVE
jgi:hypothetical protein